MLATNKSCSLISKEDNEQVFKLLGLRCQSLAAAVVQVFVTEPPLHSQWVKKDTGILCFVKDDHYKTFFFRLFCLRRNSMVWQQEVYKNMEYNIACEFLHTFEGEGCMVSFNFANVPEAQKLEDVVKKKLLSKKRREAKQDKKKNVTADVINDPTEFRHVSHVDWNSERGFVVTGGDSQLQLLLQRITTPNKPQDADAHRTALNQDHGLERAEEEAVPPLPPRGASRTNHGTIVRPPPPPSSLRLPPSASPLPPSQPLSSKFPNAFPCPTNNTTVAPVSQELEDFEFRPRTICVICLDEDATHLVVPCGHKIYCRSCAKIDKIVNAKRCPVCNGEHKMVIMVRE